jgi:diguanylate cyclase (GGDEF)-like protein
MTAPGASLPWFSRHLWLTLGMFVAFSAAFFVYALSERQIDRANEARQQSHLLADELRQSSDDLTRMVRTYVVTGNPIHKQHYQEILDIRDGRKPRPAAYPYVYWDLVLADDRRPPPAGPTVPLLELMRQAGFTEEEFASLADAKANSDALTRTEFAAMKLIESAGQPAQASRATAIGMLHDAAYHQAKASIMRPIGDFHRLADQRTLAAVQDAKAHATRMRVIFILLGLLLVSLLWRARRNLHAILGGSVDDLYSRIAELGSGKFSRAIPVAKGRENSVLGWLSRTQINLDRIDTQRRQAEEVAAERTKALNESVRQLQLAAERAEYLAFHDGLTTLPNRVLFSKLLGQSINQARRYNRQLAVLFLDLDRFKHINDTLGHTAGDQLLQEVAARLKAGLRDSDTVARLGGDEFVAVLPELQDEKYVATVARKMLSAIGRPFVLLGHDYRVTASVGISIYPQDGLDEETLTKNADTAMYQAKEEGKNNFRFYSDQLNTDSLERLALGARLRDALARGEFQLHFQTKRDTRSGRITGVEALLRWQHPDLGMVAPMQFIPIAEETGLIVPIGKWVLRTACLQNVAWQKQGLPPLSMAVNLTARQFADEHLLADVTAILADTGMDAGLLELEITESMLMRDVEKAMRVLTALKGMGIRIAIDDFGIGYSSLSKLRQFPVDTIKIDRSFIRDIASVAEHKELAKAIIALGRALSLTVVAQGVETREQADFLLRNSCSEFQGFYLDKPAPANQLAQMLRTQADAAAIAAIPVA